MKTIGRYIIKGLLGRGGMGKVYRVELPPIGKIAALKRLSPDPLLEKLLGSRKIESLFLAEAMTLAEINHPNIVEILDFDQDNGHLFYVMSYHADNLGRLMGETYRPEIQSRILPVEKALSYCRQILKGLGRLHYCDILHRDVKPFNVLITESEILKLCDFGLSKRRGETFKGPSNLNVGSPFYAAPEQEKNPNEVDFSADLYSVGVILYRMLTGNLPLTGNQYIQPSAVNADMDEKWDDFHSKALSLNPAERFQSADQMIHQLDQLAVAWRRRKEKICTLAPPLANKASTSSTPTLLRSSSCKVSPSKAKALFGLDALWRPEKYVANQFVVLNGDLIEDRAAGLIWQRSGSPYPLDWHQAHSYVNQLNKNRFSRREDWRLPTITELSTLLTELPHGEGLCIPPVFDLLQNSLWSNDLCSHTAAWLVNLELGFVSSQDHSARYYARAVCRNHTSPRLNHPRERPIYPVIK